MKLLVITGERRQESIGRNLYNEMEVHSTHTSKRKYRIVHEWRPVIDWSIRDVWEIIRRNRIHCHPTYRLLDGFNRVSCMMCIFSLPRHGLR